MIQYYGTGRRKTSIARVYLRPGNGKIDVVVNHKRRELDAYFTLEYWKSVIKKPLLTTETVDKFDAIVFLTGGGISAQADAVRLGLVTPVHQATARLAASRSAGVSTEIGASGVAAAQIARPISSARSCSSFSRRSSGEGGAAQNRSSAARR